jgi:ribose transport system substrate-binding protein
MVFGLAACNDRQKKPIPMPPSSAATDDDQSSEYATKEIKDHYVIYVSQRWGYIPFCKTILQGAKDAVKYWSERLDITVEIVFSDSGISTPELQVHSMIEMAEEGVDGMLLFPGESAMVCDALISYYNARKIPVVITDIGVDRGEYLSTILTDNYQGGEIAAEIMANAVASGSKVVVLNNAIANNNARLRADGFMDKAEKLGLTVLHERAVELSEESAYDEMINVLVTDPDIAGVFTLNSVPAKGVVEALDSTQNKNCKVVTFDLDAYVLDAIVEKKIVACIVQDPYYMGYEGINQLFYYYTGQYGMIRKDIVAPTSTCTFQNFSTYINNPQVKTD